MFLHLAVVSLLVLATGCHKGPPASAVDANLVEEAEPEPAVRHERVDNPFDGARFFVNPDFRKEVLSTLAYAPPDLLTAINMVSDTPTAVWLDRIAAIGGYAGHASLRDQLDEALRQQAASDKPLTIVFVLYNLPDRDCAAAATAGELKLAEDGLRRYREEFVDPIVSLLGEPQYEALRIALILEPDSLPNLVTNLESHEACRVAAPAYREGIAYAIERLATLDNAYVYVDIAHSGWLGWDRPAEAAALYREVLQAAGGEDKITGFATNLMNYTPLAETDDPYAMTDLYGRWIEEFYFWNRIIDEHGFVDAMREHFPDHGFVIDTSRNGWGSRLEEFPLDGRRSRGNWCNVQGAGLGASPRANPREGVHAYFWVKPPGESDGTSDPDLAEAEGVPYDPMCNPDTWPPTDASPNAPVLGAWFAEAFLALVRNANPPF